MTLDNESSDNAKNAITQLYFEEYTNNYFVYISDDDLVFSMRTGHDQKNIRIVREYFKAQGFRKNYEKASFVIKTLHENIPGSKVSSRCIYNPKKLEFVVINSVSDYLNLLKRIPDTKNEIFYRGQSNFKWKLLPSIYRHPTLVIKEKLMIDKMMQTNPEEFNFSSTFDVLSKLQHYNLPTRLIDITINPLVALFFAAYSNTSEDGQIFIFDPPDNKIKYSDSDTVSVLSNISKMDKDFGNKDIGTEKTGRLIHFIRKEKSFFEDYLEENCFDNYVFVHANYNNKRIAKQNGAFILVGIRENKLQSTDVNTDFFIGKKPIKVIIPHTVKTVLLNELEILSIHNGTLFPEIDKEAEHIMSTILYI